MKVAQLQFEPIFSSDRLLGWRAQKPPFFFFFGARHCDEGALQSEFGDLQFSLLKQVHGCELIEIHRHQAITNVAFCPEADAQWTRDPQVGLIARSADCIPILISHPNFVCSIHAGWRGVLNQIVPLSLKQLFAQFSYSNELCLTFGPHILKSSFEVQRDLIQQFKSQLFNYPIDWAQVVLPHNDPYKNYIDLASILMCQLKSVGISNEQITPFLKDTFLDQDLHSFRRDKTSAGRNLNFVARRSK